MRYARLAGEYLRLHARVWWEHRGDLAVGVAADLVYQALNLVLIAVVYGHVDALAGWGPWELAFLYGYFLLPAALFQFVAGGIWEFADRYVVRGELDRVLVRPAPALLQVLLEGLDLEAVSGLLSGTALLAVAWSRLGLDVRWYDPLLLLLLVLGSTGIYLGVYGAVVAAAFWADGRTGLLPLLWNVNQYGRYPPEIYSRPLRWVLTFVLPFAFAGAYPASYWLSRRTWVAWAAWTPVAAAGCLGLAAWIWRAGLRRYAGAGS